jgi:microcystin-dependent protein
VVNRVQSIRYYTTLQRPPSTEFSGEIYINFADIQIGALNTGKTPVDFVAVRYYSQVAKYVAGDFAIYNGSLYRCIGDTTLPAGAFDTTKWSIYADVQEVNILIGQETTRAEAEEAHLQAEIDAEITRAEAAEQNLQNEINGLTTSISHILPPGVSMDYYGVSPPTGWLLENGTIYSVATYPALGALLGATYGGDGVSTFAVPNSVGRFRVATGTGFALGSTGGTTSATLGINNIPSHTHTIQPHTHTSSPHSHQMGPGGYGVIHTGVDIAPGPGGAGSVDISTLNTGSQTVTIANSAVLTTDATGSSGGSLAPISTLPPYMARTRIIKT